MVAIIDNEKLRREFAARLKEAADEAGVPPLGEGRARDIAREVSARIKKITRPAVSKWLHGDSLPGNANMKALADILGVRREWLQYGILPKHGAMQLTIKPGPYTAKLAVKLNRLESSGRLNRKLYAAINALLDSAE